MSMGTGGGHAKGAQHVLQMILAFKVTKYLL